MTKTTRCEVAVLGGGPGGYTAAFRAADLGKEVVLIEKEDRIGGVCLNVGCIPSKTLLHTAEIILEAQAAAGQGILFTKPEIDIKKLQAHKESVVKKLTNGLAGLAKARKVKIIRGRGQFASPHSLEVTGPKGRELVEFDQAVIAVGSQPARVPSFPQDDKRIWDSTDALALPFIPPRLLVIGGGIIGLEMAQVYSALGSQITIVEMLDQLIPPADADLVRPLAQRLKKKYQGIYTSTKVTGVKPGKKTLKVSLDGPGAPAAVEAEAILVSVGRRPSGGELQADKAGVEVDDKGFIPVNPRQETNVPHIYAIGDVTGNPMLAHKATHQGKTAAEVIAGEKSAFTPMTIPSVAYTVPEIAWTGITEKEARAGKIPFEKGAFPWAASGRALSAGGGEGLSKALFHKETGRLIGAGITGARAGDLIAEATLALEMGADAQDIGRCIHPHPTFAETFAFAAEMVEGSITDIMPPPKPAKKK